MEADAAIGQGEDSGETIDASIQDRDAGAIDAGAVADAGSTPDAAAEDAAIDAQQMNECGGFAELDASIGASCVRGIGVCPNGRNCATQSEWACASAEALFCACCELP